MQRRQVLTALVATGAWQRTHAAAYPERPVRWVVPFPPGGPVDAIARKLAEHLSRNMGTSIVVDNKPGANGSIGTAEVARASADGYTLALAIPDSLISVASLVKAPPYDARSDLTLVTKMVASPLVMMVAADVGATTLAELLLRAKDKPGALAYSSWGPGTMPHLLMAALESATPARFNHVPYKGVAPALQDLAGKQVQIGFGPAQFAAQYAQKGLAVPVALTGPERAVQLPNVPTFVEQGFGGPMESSRIWIGLVGPRGLPGEIVARWNNELDQVIAGAEFRAFLSSVGFVPALGGSRTFATELRSDYETTNALIKRLGVRPE